MLIVIMLSVIYIECPVLTIMQGVVRLSVILLFLLR
jgi:hypothetical protein